MHSLGMWGVSVRVNRCCLWNQLLMYRSSKLTCKQTFLGSLLTSPVRRRRHSSETEIRRWWCHTRFDNHTQRKAAISLYLVPVKEVLAAGCTWDIVKFDNVGYDIFKCVTPKELLISCVMYWNSAAKSSKPITSFRESLVHSIKSPCPALHCAYWLRISSSIVRKCPLKVASITYLQRTCIYLSWGSNTLRLRDKRARNNKCHPTYNSGLWQVLTLHWPVEKWPLLLLTAGQGILFAVALISA